MRHDVIVVGVNIGDNKVGRTPYLTVPGVLGEENRLPIPAQLHKNGEPRLKAVLPIDREAKSFYVEGEAAPRVGDTKLRGDRLIHVVPIHSPWPAIVGSRMASPLGDWDAP